MASFGRIAGAPGVLAIIFVGIGSQTPADAQEKPRTFVQGKGSENLVTSGSSGWGQSTWGSRSTLDSHDEGIEVTKDLRDNCPGVTVTLNQSNADYTITLNRESKHNRGLLRTNSQLQVANRVGDVIGTNATRTVGHAARDACEMILADWQAHGSLNVQVAASPAPVVPPAPMAPPPAPRLPETQVEQQASVQTREGGTSPLAKPQQNTFAEATAGAGSNAATAQRGIIVRFTSTPANAEVDVDGEYWGTTPTVDMTRLSEGQHVIAVRKAGYEGWVRKITVAPGENRTIAAELRPEDNKRTKPRIAGLD